MRARIQIVAPMRASAACSLSGDERERDGDERREVLEVIRQRPARLDRTERRVASAGLSREVNR